MRHGGWMAVSGSSSASSLRLLCGRFADELLYGVHPSDPMTYVLVALALGRSRSIATILPARRATRVDPAVALRSE